MKRVEVQKSVTGKSLGAIGQPMVQKQEEQHHDAASKNPCMEQKARIRASRHGIPSFHASVFLVVSLFILVLCCHVCHAFVLPDHGQSLNNPWRLLGEHSYPSRHLRVHMVPQTRTTMATPTTTIVTTTTTTKERLYDLGEKRLNFTSDNDSTLTSIDPFSTAMLEHTTATTTTVMQAANDNDAERNNASNGSDSVQTPKAESDEHLDDSPEDEENGETSSSSDTISNRQVALYRAGLLQKGPSKKESLKSTERKTSVGERRVGSATQARRGIRRTTQLVDAVRQKARGIASNSSNNNNKSNEKRTTNNDGDNNNNNKSSTTARLSSTKVHSTIEEMLLRKRRAARPSQADRFTAAISSWGKSMGILGDEGGQPKTHVLSESPSLVVRVATPMDDVDIANLRLSVFSDFSPEMQSQFCFRSCQALAHRRAQGAICVVATPPPDKVRPVVFGSAECSYHEFTGTKLGRRRTRGSLLYITEVAVHPSARRQGIGAKLLDAIDAVAHQKEIETLYLHVDVSNEAAIALYKKCGYRLTDPSEPIFQEFTKLLNLHPGGTRGRSHYLLYKNLRVPTWVEEKTRCTEEDTKVLGNLGFEIPA